MRYLMRSLTVLAVATLLSATVQAQTASVKIGVFDPQRVSQETIQGKGLQTALTDLQKKKQAELKAKGEQLAGLEKQFAEQALSLSAERRASLQIEIERRKLELENARNLASQELQLEFAGAQGKFNEMLLASVESFGRSEGFDLILDVGAVAWAAETVDVTTAIIDRLNAMFPQGAEAEGP